jgi:tRNA wybutosine-synthesizing protein 4
LSFRSTSFNPVAILIMAKKRSDGQDKDATIKTNSYSIVSKRSVEKLYLKDEPAFLEPFVPVFKRRAPLINRGYWLRMRAIESVVQTFSDTRSTRKKVIVNLGCGYDPLPFRMRNKGVAGSTIFVDVDYMELMKNRVDVILKTPSFVNAIDADVHLSEDDEDHIVLRSPSYFAVGVDLADIESLSRIFGDLIPVSDCDILFVAEVSITYMPIDKANELIKWAASFEHSKFIRHKPLF